MMKTFIRRVGRVLFGTVMTVSVFLGGAGCSRRKSMPTGLAMGTVQFEGRPVGDGQVNFYDPARGTGKTELLEPDGSFKLTQPIEVGSYRVVITPPPMVLGPNDTPPKPTKAANIPVRYRNEHSTEFTVDVKEGENNFTFDMRR